MKLQFKEYSSIENVERTKEINTIIQQGHSAGEWVVTEKVHGANFSFWLDDIEMRCAKRTGWLNDESSFYNFQDVRNSLAEALRKMYNEIKNTTHPNLCGMTVYGELFGGHYPHKDVERVYMSKMVQKGVYYHPGNMFIAFDIVLHELVTTDENAEPEVKHVVMDHDFVYDACSAFGITHVPVLFRGTFEDCLKYPNEFQSVVPKLFGLPLLDDNIAEGVVLKPAQPKFYWGGGRVMLKNKNAKWSEKAKKQKQSRDVNSDNNFEFVLSDQAQALTDEILTFVTENRLHNVLSKMDQITDRHFGMIVGNMNRDIIDEFFKDFKEQFLVLEEKERKFITKRMGNEVMQLVRKHFVNILDGSF